MINFVRAAVSILIALLASTATVRPVTADEAMRVNTGSNNVAIKGYDPVAYFTEGQPTKGRPDVAYSWNGAQWQFANAAHRDMFAASPERYAPQFGGFCSMAMTRSKIADVDPEAWTIVDGKLYLNFSKPVREKFRQNARGNIKNAEENWKKIHQQR